jgi:hypothetical protein
MSWLFSQALVAEYSADISLAGELSAPSSGNPTQQAFLSHGKTTGFSRLSRFGMTCKPLTGTLGEALLTSYLAASHARTSAQPARARVLRGGVEVASGVKWPESSVRFDPDSSSWKTAHCLWEEVLPSSSVTLPRWGMTRNGHVSAHPTAERPINVTASGLWPTPNVPNGGRSCAHVTEWSESGKTAYHNGKKVQVGLEHAAKYWPTPTVCGNNQAPKDGTKRGTGLATAAKTWPTPTVNDSKNSTLPPSQINHDNIPGALLRDGETAGGQLNPTWVEWLMGWPLGWTDLKPLAMDKFREWQQQHMPCFLDDREAA